MKDKLMLTTINEEEEEDFNIANVKRKPVPQHPAAPSQRLTVGVAEAMLVISSGNNSKNITFSCYFLNLKLLFPFSKSEVVVSFSKSGKEQTSSQAQ